ncbi:MAG: PAS domain-containing protein, partial [Bacteroidota bacterium]
MKKKPHIGRPVPRGVQLKFEADENLKRSLSLLQATLDSTADGILVVDAQGKIERFNKKFLEMWRIPSSIVESREDDKAIAFVLDQLKDPEQFLKKVRDLYAQPDATSFDSLEFKDGRVFERYSQPQRIDGKSVGRVWSFRDITESAKAGRELHSSEKKFRALFENVLDGMYQSTPEGRLLMVNPALIRMLGYDSEEELLKADIATDLYMDPQQRLSLMKKYDLDGLVRSEELTLLRKDGAAITVLENSRTVRDDSGKILYYEGTLTDITEQKKAE